MIKIRYLLGATVALAGLHSAAIRVVDARERTAEREAYCAQPFKQVQAQVKPGCLKLAGSPY